LIRFFSAEIFR